MLAADSWESCSHVMQQFTDMTCVLLPLRACDGVCAAGATDHTVQQACLLHNWPGRDEELTLHLLSLLPAGLTPS